VTLDFWSLEGVPIWALLIMGILSHARGTVLLLREVRLWWFKGRIRGKPPRSNTGVR